MHNVYESIMMQLCHDIANIAQKMISISYEYDLKGIKIGKIDGEIKRLSEILSIYKNIYSAEYDDFYDLIDSMQLLYGNIIAVDEDESFLQDTACIPILRLTLVYALWIAKNHDINITLHHDKSEISISDKHADKIKFYLPDDNKDTFLVNIIKYIAQTNHLDISIDEDRIVIEAKKLRNLK